jgi:hypothetical protein
MGARDRVREAIQAPVDAAEQELRELQGADVETRLTVLVDGWARGLAAALEELAIAIDELARDRATVGEGEDTTTPTVDEPADEPEDRPDEPDLAGASEEQLADEARRSRAATAELQEEGEEARSRLERGGR